MRRKTRAKVNRILKIAGIIGGIALIIGCIIIAIKLNQKPSISYDDKLVGKNYFEKITIDLSTKKIKRDNVATTLVEEFQISEDEENLALSSPEELNNLLSQSSFDVSNEGDKYVIKNQFQTKKLLAKANSIDEVVKGEEIIELQKGLYLLNFYSEKLTKAMYEYYKNKPYIEKIYLDDVNLVSEISDESQTMYGGGDTGLGNYHSLGALTLGLDNYHKIIEENGNPKEIVISSIGYGIDNTNEFFRDRLYGEGYNFILDNNDISETISQGSRIAEVLVDSTSSNVKLEPLVVVTEEGYTSTSSIIRAITHATRNSDVICYELINKENEVIDLVLENAFKENIPVCTICIATDEQNYPAQHAMTIATASLNRENELADYSGKGDFIDFSAPSTDVIEIFKNNKSVSRWSGPEYSNAQIAAEIALIKTYNKDATILEIYNFLRNFCEDLGEEGKDDLYGYGMPKFSELTIADIDKEEPKFVEIAYENETWEVQKQIRITANDNIRMNFWAITKNTDMPNEEEWKVLENITPDLDTITEIPENGTYNIWLKDSAGNTTKQTAQIDKVDNTPPKLGYTINKDNIAEGYVTISVIAEDEQSGLSETPFSWDGTTWSQENSEKKVIKNGRYIIYVIDKLGNKGEQEIIVDAFPQEGTAEIGEGDIIESIYVSSEWNGNINNNVQIKLKQNSNIIGWQLAQTMEIPNVFVPVNQETNQTENSNNNNTQNIEINRDNNTINTNINSYTNTNTNTSINSNTSTNTNLTRNETLSLLSNSESEQIFNVADHNNTVMPTFEQSTRADNVIRNNEPIQITKALSVETDYYIWVKYADGNTSYQKFVIHKPVI